MPYLDTPGGKMEVSQEVVELMLRLGTPCKKVERPNPYVEKGFEYFWYKNEHGKMITRIRSVKKGEGKSNEL